MRLYNQKPARQRWGVGKEILGRNERKIVENMTDKIKNFFAQAGEVAERLAHGAWRGVKFATNAVLSAFVAVASIYAMPFDMVTEMATKAAEHAFDGNLGRAALNAVAAYGVIVLAATVFATTKTQALLISAFVYVTMRVGFYIGNTIVDVYRGYEPDTVTAEYAEVGPQAGTPEPVAA